MPKASPKEKRYDAIGIGAGPNGLSAAIRLAQESRSVLVIERSKEPGGGTRTAELTLPGFWHDVCSAAHPMGVASPYLKTLGLEDFGLEWIQPDLPVAQTLDPRVSGGVEGVALHRDVAETAAQFSSSDGARYRGVFQGITKDAEKLYSDLLGPARLPKHPIAAAKFGLQAILPATLYWETVFRSEASRALFAGNAAHSIVSLNKPFTSAIGLMLQGAAHAVGWPIAKGGSQGIWKAMVTFLESLGGEVCTDFEVHSLEQLPEADHYFFDTSPSAMVSIAGEELPHSYQQRLSRYRHGPGVFKLDLALSDPIPWTSEVCRRAGTVHVSGSAEETAISEASIERDQVAKSPFLLVSQPATFDSSRAPQGKHIAWAYCHTPPAWQGDESERILQQIERFAPGFRDTILASHSMSCSDFERYNPNYIGGDIACGASDFTQLLTRPVAKWTPYKTPNPKILLCSAATPPGAGVHGMAGYHAAEAALS